MSDQTPSDRPLALRIGLAVVLLEAVVLVVLGAGVVIASVLDDGAMLGINAGVLAVLVLIGGFLLLAVRGLWQGKRWGRGPVITWQLLQFFVAITSWGGLEWWALVPALLLPVIVLVCLLTPASLSATAERGRPDGVL